MEKEPLLEIAHLEITYQSKRQQTVIIKDVSFTLYTGEMVALTGKSGAGKSILSQALVGLLDKGLIISKGHIFFEGVDIAQLKEKEFEKLRRNHIGIMLQNSLNSLDPIRLVKKQMFETIHHINFESTKQKENLLIDLLKQVGFEEPNQILNSYPFELSGGMRQRVLLAMMLSLKPKILIADEPTTALDVINRIRVLDLFKKLQHNLGLTILLISHDESSIKRYADRIIYMREGGILL